MDQTKGCKQQEKKQEGGTFVLPAITTMCTSSISRVLYYIFQPL